MKLKTYVTFTGRLPRKRKISYFEVPLDDSKDLKTVVHDYVVTNKIKEASNFRKATYEVDCSSFNDSMSPELVEIVWRSFFPVSSEPIFL